MEQPHGHSREEELYTLSYMQQLYQNQYNELASAINRNVQYLNELAALKKTLDESALVDGKEVLVDLGANAYLSSRVKKLESVLIDIGAGYIVEKSVEDAKLFVDSRTDRSTQSFNGLVKSRNELRDAILEVARRIDALNQA